MSWPWPKVIFPRSRSQFTLSQNLGLGHNSLTDSHVVHVVDNISQNCCPLSSGFAITLTQGHIFKVKVRAQTYPKSAQALNPHYHVGPWYFHNCYSLPEGLLYICNLDSREGWALKPVNHTSWVAVVTPTDRPKSVCNRCVIKLFCCVVSVVTLPFGHFCWCRGFCHRTESDLFLFLFTELLSMIQGLLLSGAFVSLRY